MPGETSACVEGEGALLRFAALFVENDMWAFQVACKMLCRRPSAATSFVSRIVFCLKEFAGAILSKMAKAGPVHKAAYRRVLLHVPTVRRHGVLVCTSGVRRCGCFRWFFQIQRYKCEVRLKITHLGPASFRTISLRFRDIAWPSTTTITCVKERERVLVLRTQDRTHKYHDR